MRGPIARWNKSVFPAYAGMSPGQTNNLRARVSFPRLRGDEPTWPLALGPGGVVFPAYAGMSPAYRQRLSHQRSFPRLRGDEPGIVQLLIRVMEFSPPTRG